MRPLPTCWVAASTLLFLPLLALHARKTADGAAKSATAAGAALALKADRGLPSDLEVGGELAGLPAGSRRYVTLNSLLGLPQTTYTVADDTNFAGSTRISGVPLDTLERLLAAAPESDMVVAICDDEYRANYPRAYVAAHHPLLVLKVNGEPPSRWPKDRETHRYDMGPYMISHPTFKPSSGIFSHMDQAQIPWGVVRLEFRDEKAVFSAIAPRGPRAGDASVQAGYIIAQQNCFRCHNAGGEGGQKSGIPWLVLAARAAASPEYFSAYVRDPMKRNPRAQMPGNAGYDGATLRALRDYFATLASREAP
jgi:mono/diheme cytochrome c family protein